MSREARARPGSFLAGGDYQPNLPRIHESPNPGGKVELPGHGVPESLLERSEVSLTKLCGAFAHRPKRALENTFHQIGIIVRQLGAIKTDRFPVPLRAERDPGVLDLPVEAEGLGSESVRHPEEGLRSAGSNLSLDERQETVPEAVAEVAEVLVGGVLPPVDLAPAEVLPEFLAADLEQGADPDPPPRRHADEPPKPGPAEELKEDGLYLIVSVVAEEDGTCSDSRGEAPGGASPEGPGRGFAGPERAPIPRVLSDSVAARRESETPGQLPDEPGVVPGVRPPSVVDVEYVQSPSTAARFADGEVQERHGIGSTGNGHEDGGSVVERSRFGRTPVPDRRGGAG